MNSGMERILSFHHLELKIFDVCLGFDANYPVLNVVRECHFFLFNFMFFYYKL